MRFSKIIVCLIFSTLTCCAQDKKQSMIIHQTDGSELNYLTENIDSITFSDNSFENKSEGITVKRIYGDGSTYCAFTSLIKRNNSYYLAFREGATHVADGDYGIIKILKSNDGDNWETIQTLSADIIDLRDPDLSIMPDGRIIVLCGARIKGEKDYYTKTFCSFEDSFEHFEEVKAVKVPETIDDEYCCWIWRLTWNGNKGYGVAYRTNDDQNYTLSLLTTENGKDYELINNIDVSGVPTETRLRFTSDNTMYAMVRRSGSDGRGIKGYLGRSKPPYIEWNWKEIGVYLAGQDFIIDGSQIICATRMSQNIGEYTSVFIGDLNGNFRWNYILPSSGTNSDTAYAGLLDNGEEYWVSYYSMHETEKPSVFIARIPKKVLPQ